MEPRNEQRSSWYDDPEFLPAKGPLEETIAMRVAAIPVGTLVMSLQPFARGLVLQGKMPFPVELLLLRFLLLVHLRLLLQFLLLSPSVMVFEFCPKIIVDRSVPGVRAPR